MLLKELGELFFRPIERLTLNYNTAYGISVSVKTLCSRIDNYVCSVFERSVQIGSCHRVINNKRYIMLMCDLGNSVNIKQSRLRIRDALYIYRLGVFLDVCFPFFKRSRMLYAVKLYSELGEDIILKIECSSVDLVGRQYPAGASRNRYDSSRDGCHTGRHRYRSDASVK